MADPVLDLADDPQRIAGAIGRGHVAWEFLVGEVGVVLKRAGRLDDIDAAAAFAPCQLGTPGRGLQRGAEINMLQLAVDEVAAITGLDQVADAKVGLGAVVKGRAGGGRQRRTREISS
jgi:hypothetical protein